MRTKIAAAAGTLLLIAAWAAADDYGPLRAIGEGRALYLANCASCHGTDARGLASPALDRLFARDGAFDALRVANHIEGRRDGVTGKPMPAWGTRLQASWPYGRAGALMQIQKLTRYLEFAQVDADRPALAAATTHR